MKYMRRFKWTIVLFALFAFYACVKVEPENEEKEIERVNVTKIKLLYEDKEILVEMLDNHSVNDFLNLLPLELPFEDYNQSEKITSLPSKLSTENAPSGMTPKTGDFSYYAPWGNLAVYYKDFSYSTGVIQLGTIVEGLDNLSKIEDGTIVTIEIYE